ncbi:MAG: 30S ribosomal protein S1 [Armatimonadetes bacterium]|nr:30S ribosomal protein S1 [Armatimonadota bacterium]
MERPDSVLMSTDLPAADETTPPPSPPANAEEGAVEDKPQSREEAPAFGEMLDASMKKFQYGEVVKGTVVRVDSDGVLVDIGGKTEGIIPLQELSHKTVSDPATIVAEGQEIDVLVVKFEDRDGNLILSKRRADMESAWRRIVNAHKTGEILTATVIDQVKGGLIVDLGVQGFLPASHVDTRPPRNLDDFVGEALRFRIIELDRNKRKVILSRKVVMEEEREKQKHSVFSELYEGQIREGTVARFTNFGAFINLGGIDGLIHLSELAWNRVNHPSEVMKLGEKVQVLILKIDKDRERVSLSLRQARMDPWMEVETRFRIGDIVNGEITKIVKNYAFARVSDGVEGLIPANELSETRVKSPSDVVSLGQKVKVKVLDVRVPERRMLLSLKEAEESQYSGSGWSAETGGKNAQQGTGTTLGEILGNRIRVEVQAPVPAKAPPMEKPDLPEPQTEARAEEGPIEDSETLSDS